MQHGKSGYVAKSLGEFAPLADELLSLSRMCSESMRAEARNRALSIGSWEQIFLGMYQTYGRYVQPPVQAEDLLLDDARKIMNT